MKNPNGVYADPGGDTPVTIKELFHALAVSINKSGTGTDYGWPWIGYKAHEDGGLPCYKQARARLGYFEQHSKHVVTWVYFNDNASNEGAMSLNSDPGRAFAERITNGIDARIELKILGLTGEKPSSPLEAVRVLCDIDNNDFKKKDDDIRKVATENVLVRHYAPSNTTDNKDNVLDARDYGIGMTAEEMPLTILSLNRGNKKDKMYLTGKHGQGASSTFQFADMTVIVSRKVGTNKVAFTIVEKYWARDEHGRPTSKTPTYRSLRIDGKVPEIDVEDAGGFEVGTLVRHIGYEMYLPNNFGENSVVGMLARTLATALMPIGVEHYFMRYGLKSNGGKGDKKKKFDTSPGRRTYRTTRGAIATLRRAHWETYNVPEAKRPNDGVEISHYYSEPFLLGKTDLGGRDGVVDMGHVRFEWWVTVPKDPSKPSEPLRAFVDDAKPILFTLDGQTHAEELKGHILTMPTKGGGGAGLWAIGKRMIVHINCDGLDQCARYELFTSTREHLKENPLKRRILEELVHRLKRDDVLVRMNRDVSAPPVSSDELDDDFAKQVKQHLKAGVALEALTRRVKEKYEIEDEQTTDTGGPSRKGKKPPAPPAPIEATDNPTFLRWRMMTRNVKMYPGQRYSWVFETNAPAIMWDPENPLRGRIQLLDSAVVRYSGAAPWDGGRVRCRFECPENAVIGTAGTIQVQMRTNTGMLLADMITIEVVARPEHKHNEPGEKNDGDEMINDGQGPGKTTRKIEKTRWVERQIPLLRPVPVSKTKNAEMWGALGWDSENQTAFAMVRDPESNIQRLYYNVDYPGLVEHQRKWASRGLDKAFTDRYLVKLTMHGLFAVNHGVPDEAVFGSGTNDAMGVKANMRRLACATNDDLLWAASAEIEKDLREQRETA